MELISSLAVMRASLSLRSPDEYDSLQICLQETCSREIKLLMVQSVVGSVFIMDDSLLSATCDWLDLSSFILDLSQKSVSPPLPWFNYDTSMLLLRPPPWPDWGCVMRFNPIVLALLLSTAFIGKLEMNAFKPGRIDGNHLVAFYCSPFIFFYCLVSHRLWWKILLCSSLFKELNSMNKVDNE